MKRRAAIEPSIGHLKNEHRLECNRLRGTCGDAINAVLAAAHKDQERKLELIEDLKSFSDYKEWALNHKDDWETIDRRFRQMLEFLPLDENPELSISVHSAEALMDWTYDIADFYATWSNLQQLDHKTPSSTWRS